MTSEACIAHVVFPSKMAAETIVKYMTENPRTKLLVILRRGYRINPRNVSHYVAEKCKLRQLILDRSGGLAPARPNLLDVESRFAERLVAVNRRLFLNRLSPPSTKRAPTAGRFPHNLLSPRRPKTDTEHAKSSRSSSNSALLS